MPAETMFPLSRTRPHAAAVRHGPAHCRRKREGATQFPTIGLFARTRTILKEPDTRRLKNRGHLARNRKFESISLQRRVHCELAPHSFDAVRATWWPDFAFAW